MSLKMFIRSLVLMVVLTSSAVLAFADDDEGTILIQSQSVGPYLITVLNTPDAIISGEATISVVVTDASGDAVPDVSVDVEAVGPGQPTPRHFTATHDNATNEQMYAAFVDLPMPGRWSFTVHVESAGDVPFQLDVRPPRPYRFASHSPSVASARLRLGVGGSTPGLLVTDDGQARMVLSAGALQAVGPGRVQVELRPEDIPPPVGAAVRGMAYRIQAISTANGQPVAEPWSAPVELALRVPGAAVATGLFRIEQGQAISVPGSAVSNPCGCSGGARAQAAIDRAGIYVVGN
jgi:YtkA-like